MEYTSLNHFWWPWSTLNPSTYPTLPYPTVSGIYLLLGFYFDGNHLQKPIHSTALSFLDLICCLLITCLHSIPSSLLGSQSLCSQKCRPELLDYHCKLYRFHQTRLETNFPHRQVCHPNSITSHIHPSCCSSNALSNALHLDNKTYLDHSSYHYSWILHTCCQSNTPKQYTIHQLNQNYVNVQEFLHHEPKLSLNWICF